MTTITEQIQELQNLTVAELATRYEALHGKPPRVRNKAYLRRQVAWKLQEREFGGLSERARTRLDELISEIDLPLGDPGPRRSTPKRKDARAPLVGTTLVRTWKGRELRVEVREHGFEFDGVIYRSLSAVARAITGSNWNGPLFFNLRNRRSAS